MVSKPLQINRFSGLLNEITLSGTQLLMGVPEDIFSYLRALNILFKLKLRIINSFQYGLQKS